VVSACQSLVGEVSGEADERRARALVGLRCDQALALEDAPDGGDGGRVAELEAEVVSDGVRPAIVARRSQLVTPADDGRLDLRRGGVGAAVRSSGAGFHGGIAPFAESREELVEPEPRDAVGRGHLAHTALLQ
jgi:hypothetical protein